MMTKPLTEKKCEPCEGKTRPLTAQEVMPYLVEVPGWMLNSESTLISREWVAKNFMEAVQFINKIAKIAEEENHHPDIHLTSYRKIKVELTTHAIKGLSENDFIVAAKINKLPVELKR